ncbi:hypothetical protein SCHPADRAFT_813738, partial [Schizopora paradoxa]
PRVKPPPKASGIKVPFEYAPSADGIDENLLILLHGLGDTHKPFAKLGKQLNLPQTAILALRAPEQIPFLYDEEAFQWYTSFSDLGEPITHPNPAPALALLTTVLTHLTQACCWQVHNIHLFGFAQGGSVALEFAVAWWKSQKRESTSTPPAPATSTPPLQNATTSMASSRPTGSPLALASVVSIAGPPLLQHALSSKCPTPLFLFHRAPPSTTSSASSDAKRNFSDVREATFVDAKAGESMPRSRDEWAPIMEFWSQRLTRRAPQADGVEGLYEVLSSGLP